MTFSALNRLGQVGEFGSIAAGRKRSWIKVMSEWITHTCNIRSTWVHLKYCSRHLRPASASEVSWWRVPVGVSQLVWRAAPAWQCSEVDVLCEYVSGILLLIHETFSNYDDDSLIHVFTIICQRNSGFNIHPRLVVWIRRPLKEERREWLQLHLFHVSTVPHPLPLYAHRSCTMCP